MINNEEYKKKRLLLEQLYAKPAWKWAAEVIAFLQERQQYLCDILIQGAKLNQTRDTSVMKSIGDAAENDLP